MKTRTQQIEEYRKSGLNRVGKALLARTARKCGEITRFSQSGMHPGATGRGKMWRLLHGESKKGYINSLGD